MSHCDPTRASDAPFAARPNRMVRFRASVHRDMAMADVVPSEELRSLLLRLYSAMQAQDVETLREMFSTSAHALAIGTDPSEWWTGSDALEVWSVQIREAGGFRFQSSRPTAYCVGPVGWVADDPLVTIGNGVEVR